MAFGVTLAIFTSSLQVAAQPGEPAASSATEKSPTAAAQPSGAINDCLSAHRDSQQFRNQGKLVESNELLQTCSRDLCPTPVRRDCQRWANEVAAQTPSIKFRLGVDDGESSRFVKIFVNDALMFNVLPTKSVQFNPGKYHLRFVADGKPTVEQEVTLGDGDQDREVIIKFDQPPPKATAPTAAATVTPTSKPVALPPAPAQVESRPVPLATYLFAGLGVAATINFAAWGISSKSLTSDLEKQCSPNCPQDEVDSARLRAAIADISLGVGVASFATATILYLVRPKVMSPVNVDVGVLPRGGWAATVRVSAF